MLKALRANRAGRSSCNKDKKHQASAWKRSGHRCDKQPYRLGRAIARDPPYLHEKLYATNHPGGGGGGAPLQPTFGIWATHT